MTTADAKRLYPTEWEYARRMGCCGNCVHLKRTPKGVRPLKFYCFYHTNKNAVYKRTEWDGAKREFTVEDREWEEDDIVYLNKSTIACAEAFEANAWWKGKVKKIFMEKD